MSPAPLPNDASLATAKAAARGEALAARDALPPECRDGAAERLAGFADAIGAAPGAVVAGFLPIRTEIDPRFLMARLAARGARLALPVMADATTLIFRAWAPGDPLVTRVWGISEPTRQAPEIDPDFVLCPLAAFDRAGNRLGHGRGYYDRALARLRAKKPVLAIGVAFECQRLDTVPTGPRDAKLDLVATERHLVDFRQSDLGRANT